MAKRERMTAADVNGVWAVMPTPSTPNASDWRVQQTVDLDEAARVVEALIVSGVDAIMSLGTFGEGATLQWEEKAAFMATLVQAACGRVRIFGGTTALNTREAVRQMRAARDLGVDGTMLGVPMWCKADVPTAVQFYRDVTEAVPELAICVYANPEAFKFEYPRPFWAQVSHIPQVITAKYLGVAQLGTDLRLTGGRIRFLPIAEDYCFAARGFPELCTAFWTGSAVCGPTPVIQLRDAVKQAKQTGDWKRAVRLSDEINAAAVGLFPKGEFSEFSKYNIGLEKARMDAAGWMRAGPCRPPYHVVPNDYLEGARSSGRLWAQLHQRCERNEL
jgi:trans-o-hydroxybenzylidenepyruvate hydratase-aldolase